MRRFMLVILCTFPFTVMAETPRYFQVTTPLTVRDEPRILAEEVGVIGVDAAPVEITAQREEWGRVAWRGVDGWIPLASLAPYAVDQLDAAAIPVGLVCGGTEPFWSLSFRGPAEAVFSAPETADITYSISLGFAAEGKPAFPAALSLVGVHAGALVLVRPQECFDGMSDMTYGWTLDLLTERKRRPVLLTGCCRLPIGE